MKAQKKPVIVEVIQWDGTFIGMREIEEYFPKLQTLSCSGNMVRNTIEHWKIGTLEGGHYVTKGDWIIQGVKGEYYPCKSDVFEMTYELIDK